jgi:hypothetical protein
VQARRLRKYAFGREEDTEIGRQAYIGRVCEYVAPAGRSLLRALFRGVRRRYRSPRERFRRGPGRRANKSNP